MRVKQIAFLIAMFLISGCVVRTYSVTKDRVDQGLTHGNRGYLKGDAPDGKESAERKSTRTVHVVETEFFPPVRLEKGPKKQTAPVKASVPSQDTEVWGNRGVVYAPSAPEPPMRQYTVEKNDTLQKISKKFYGTTKYWQKIFKANEGVLKGPDKIYPGQVINIPVEELKETEENLK